MNVGPSFYTSLGILSLPVCFVKGNKTFLNNPKTFLSFFLKVFLLTLSTTKSPLLFQSEAFGLVF